jgi:hypothetical protein
LEVTQTAQATPGTEDTEDTKTNEDTEDTKTAGATPAAETTETKSVELMVVSALKLDPKEKLQVFVAGLPTRPAAVKRCDCGCCDKCVIFSQWLFSCCGSVSCICFRDMKCYELIHYEAFEIKNLGATAAASGNFKSAVVQGIVKTFGESAELETPLSDYVLKKRAKFYRVKPGQAMADFSAEFRNDRAKELDALDLTQLAADGEGTVFVKFDVCCVCEPGIDTVNCCNFDWCTKVDNCCYCCCGCCGCANFAKCWLPCRTCCWTKRSYPIEAEWSDFKTIAAYLIGTAAVCAAGAALFGMKLSWKNAYKVFAFVMTFDSLLALFVWVKFFGRRRQDDVRGLVTLADVKSKKKKRKKRVVEDVTKKSFGAAIMARHGSDDLKVTSKGITG